MWWKNYSIWLKTERKTIISNYSDFTKIAPTVPLCIDQETRVECFINQEIFTIKHTGFKNCNISNSCVKVHLLVGILKYSIDFIALPSNCNLETGFCNCFNQITYD